MKAPTYLSILIVILISSTSNSQDRKNVELKSPDHYENSSRKFENVRIKQAVNKFEPLVSDMITIEYKPTGVHTVYDVQSIGSPSQIWQDQFVPANVHAVCMQSGNLNFSDRRCIYLFSDDFGQTWNNLGQVPDAVESGFPSISVLSSGAAIIANQNASNGTQISTKIYADAGAGFGIFTELYPGGINGIYPLFPTIISTSVLTNSVKFIFAASNYINRGISISTPSNFSGYVFYNDTTTVTTFNHAFFGGFRDGICAFARGADGRIGHTYLGIKYNTGDVFFRESFNNGLTWTDPIKIWDCNFSTDSIGCLRGVDMVYLENTPCIVFENIKLTETGFFPGLPSLIRFWSPSHNNIVIADSSSIPFYPNKGVTSEGYAPICRPVIGKSMSGYVLFVAFNTTSNNYSSVDSSNFYSIHLAHSYSEGISWNINPITPSLPLRDWRYVSISPQNSMINNSVNVQVFSQSDSVAGSFVYGGQQGRAEIVNMRISGFPIHGENTNSESMNFYLHQNIPNPFNPITSIGFDLPKTSNVTLKIYNSAGKEIITLINNETMSAGLKEVKFNGEDLPAGIYFYTLTAEDHTSTKKMLLIK